FRERRFFEKSEKIFLTPELNRFYRKTPFLQFADKFISVPFANFIPIHNNKPINRTISFEKNKLNCLFAGQLYKDIRSPSFALKLFQLVTEGIHFSLITNFNKQELEELSESSYQFSVYPFQPRDIVLSCLMEANILVNIGN